ncbi:MAG: DNA repair protein RadA [SAR202 cluster bacterium Io17-Chloro-G4]|nr:MAG: DNA repair protein RadA [SAR202 cluster bacterium Io17-Chloro-G4]
MVRESRAPKSVFICKECGHESAKWMGFCPSPACSSSLPLVETKPLPEVSAKQAWNVGSAAPIQELAEVSHESHPRIGLSSEELNRVLGGGLVPGSVVLLAGEPGVGKSTLLLQIAQSVAAQNQKVLYVSGEESPQQLKIRSQRLRFPGEGVYLFSETDVDLVVNQLEESSPALGIVDSIQTLYSQDTASGPGSVAQVREAGLKLMRWSKQRHVPLLLAGHLTKDGSVAGPRVLEHMVDVVAYMESQEFSDYRIIRSSKNRFGSTSEIGVFEMTGQGLADVADPSQALLSQRYDQAVGTALVPVLEGSRPLLMEIQALTSPSQLPVPRRVANGVDHNRLLMLAAVASRRAGLELANQDIIVSVAGGFRVSEPAADLAIVLAIASSMRNRALDTGLAAMGEVGLSGEVRSVPQAQRRLAEVSRLGLSSCLLSENVADGLSVPPGMSLVPARTLRQAFRAVLGTGLTDRADGTAAVLPPSFDPE